MYVRPFRREDLSACLHIFHEAVHRTTGKDYSAHQREAWAPDPIPEAMKARWLHTFLQHRSFVAIEGSDVIGFADMNESGYVDRMYVHPFFQRKSVATLLLHRLEEEAHDLLIETLSTHASFTALPFFKQHGFKEVDTQTVTINGASLSNVAMTKALRHLDD
ncbi:acetyltransferase [Pontibacillus halophilus JSM 076056 = DSM 19796]|uniref:Acetyltransferase n=1 Tax=Pontibacillus halophilus JSM 076056 = DSM 19796 TaxID=1385510 RepID=A0A0A5GD19_9BACI|nr:GNAT family N-acetyltransferase [Pontibacillus halophilus]KGX91106.1 acetyltransferase [Pontibacillus halophilus JSM 076056 = DSM 19796]